MSLARAWFFVLGAVAALHAGPQENAILAAMRLSEEPNYSWIATVTDDARTYDITGQTERGGFTRVKMPVVNSLRRRLGRSVTDTEIELIYRGNVEGVVATDTGWARLNDLPAQESTSDIEGGSVSLGTGPSGIGSPNGGGAGGVGIQLPTPKKSGPRHYSNLQLTLGHPHEELGVIVSSHRDFTLEGDMVTGTLTEVGARLLLVHDGQQELNPLRAEGTFKLWLHDGRVLKYQIHVEGRLEISTPKGRRQIDVHQSTETILRDIGTTKVLVPAEARGLLSPGN